MSVGFLVFPVFWSFEGGMWCALIQCMWEDFPEFGATLTKWPISRDAKVCKGGGGMSMAGLYGYGDFGVMWLLVVLECEAIQEKFWANFVVQYKCRRWWVCDWEIDWVRLRIWIFVLSWDFDCALTKYFNLIVSLYPSLASQGRFWTFVVVDQDYNVTVDWWLLCWDVELNVITFTPIIIIELLLSVYLIIIYI